MLMQQRAAWLRRTSVSILLISALSGCQSNSSDDSNDPVASAAGNPTFAEGYVIKGPVSGSKVVIYAIDSSSGTRTDVVAGPFYTDADGYWSGMVPDSDVPYEVVSTGGVYLDEATQALVTRSINDDKDVISGILDFTKSRLAIVTPLTHVAFEAAKHRAAYLREPIADALDVALSDLELTFGIDPSTTIPDFSAGVGGDATGEQRYAALLGGFSHLANSGQLVALGAAPVYEVRNALVSDLADGKLNGFGAGANPVFIKLANNARVKLPELSADGISAYLAAVNEYAQTQLHLGAWRVDEHAVLAFNSDGGQLLRGELSITAPQKTYLIVIDEGASLLYRQAVMLHLDENGHIVDEFGNQLLHYVKIPNDSISIHLGDITVNSSVYALNTLDINTRGTVAVQKKGEITPVVLGQISLAVFAQPEALEEVSPGVWRETANSGAPSIMRPLGEDNISELKLH